MLPTAAIVGQKTLCSQLRILEQGQSAHNIGNGIIACKSKELKP